MMIIDSVEFFGHPLIKATHRTTFEITKEEKLSPRGDCIIGVGANKSCIDLNDQLRRFLTNDSSVKITLYVGKYVFEVNAMGHPSLILTDQKDIVVRKSDYICPRTLAVRSDKAAIDIPRHMVLMLKGGDTKGKMMISIRT